MPRPLLSALKKNTKSLLSRAILRSGADFAPAVRVLGYHGVLGPGESGNVYDVTAAAFDGQMAELKRSGYRVVHLDEVLRLGAQPRSRERLACIIFDDGFLNSARQGAPILARHGFSATYFLVPNAMGKMSQWGQAYGYDSTQVMGWADAQELLAQGLTVGSHSLNHKTLSQLSSAELRVEVTQSKSAIEQALGVEVRSFSVPGGQDDSRLECELRRAGYRCKFSNETTRCRLEHDYSALPVTYVLATDTIQDFRDKLNGAHDWLQSYRRLRGRTQTRQHPGT